jgi:hypothetical protein
LLTVVASFLLVSGVGYAIGRGEHRRVVGYGQIRFDGLGPEAWHARFVRATRERENLQRRLTVRVWQVYRLRRTLLHRTSSLEALRLAAITFRVPFSLLYRRASCESTGQPPADPPSERTLNPAARNRSSTAEGLLQFLHSTWASTPYRHESALSPYANALAAGWMIRSGRGGEWQCP